MLEDADPKNSNDLLTMIPCDAEFKGRQRVMERDLTARWSGHYRKDDENLPCSGCLPPFEQNSEQEIAKLFRFDARTQIRVFRISS